METAGGLEQGWWQELVFSTEASNQILLIKRAGIIKPNGSEATGHPAQSFLKLPSMAILPWGFDHFISKIADCTQQ